MEIAQNMQNRDFYEFPPFQNIKSTSTAVDMQTSRGVAVNLPVCTVTASLPFSLIRFSDPTENTLTVYHAPDFNCSICTLVFSVSPTLGTWVSVELVSWIRYR